MQGNHSTTGRFATIPDLTHRQFPQAALRVVKAILNDQASTEAMQHLRSVCLKYVKTHDCIGDAQRPSLVERKAVAR
jgi:hypothetical protein